METSKIEEVRERLEKGAAGPMTTYTTVCARADLSVLLDDHARLQAQPPPAIDLEQFRGLLSYVRDGCRNGQIMQAKARELLALIDGQMAAPRPLIARPLAEWHEGDGPAMWWAWCGSDWAGEPAWCGTPNDSDWPGYHTHWTPHPAWPMQPSKGEGE